MGLLYEYSSPDTPTYRESDSATAPVDGASTLPETPPQADTRNAPATTTALPASQLRTADVVVSGLFVFMTFCFSLFASALAFTPPPPEELASSPEAFELNLQAMTQVYESQLIVLYGYTAINLAIGLMVGVGYVALRLQGNWSVLGLRRLSPEHTTYALMMGTAGALGIRGGRLLAVSLSGDLAAFREGITTQLNNTPLLITFIAILLWILVLPLLQELFFRGIIYKWLRGFRQPMGAIFINGAINGVFNLFLVDFFSGILVAMALAYIYERTGSVLGAYLAHSTFNFVTIILYVFVISFGG